jgi:hypothetical protein
MLDEHAGEGAPRPRRRTLIKSGAALGAGLTLGSGYVRPSLTSVALTEVAYASGDPTDKKEKKPKKDKDPT